MNKSTLFSLSVIALVSLLLLPVSSNAFSLFGKHKSVKSSGDAVQIPVSKVNDGKAHYYKFKTGGGTAVNFFVVRSSDGVIRAAFDACDVCFPAKKGYSQDGDFMICNNCGRRFHTSRINVEQGGCNPAPLRRAVAGGHLVIKVADIAPGSRFF